MKKKITYTDEPMELKVIENFLPPPEQLVKKQEMVKVTISLGKPTVDFFKRRARRQATPYQKMIRRVLDMYAAHYE